MFGVKSKIAVAVVGLATVMGGGAAFAQSQPYVADQLANPAKTDSNNAGRRSTCCPPWNADSLFDMMVYHGTGGIGDPYRLRFEPTPTFNNQIQAYINYVNTISPCATSAIINFKISEHGNGVVPTSYGNAVPLTPGTAAPTASQHWVEWAVNGGGIPVNPPINAFNALLEVNKWYKIQGNIYTGKCSTVPQHCAENEIFVRIQVVKSGRGPVLEFARADGTIVGTKPLRR